MSEEQNKNEPQNPAFLQGAVMRPLLANYEGNWTEDFSHENGNYMNMCIRCDQEFLGHKRRVICKKCFSNGA
jgi:hypothetical protein